MMKKYMCLAASMLVLGGCAELQRLSSSPERHYKPVVVVQSIHSDYILTCLHETGELTEEQFAVEYEKAEENLQDGTDLDKLRFICLSLNEQADFQQFQAGKEIFEELLEDRPDPGDDILGLYVLLDRLDREISTKWSAWKTLLEERKELRAEIDALQAALDQAGIKNQELEKKIEQLKNIEKIMERRETNQP